MDYMRHKKTMLFILIVTLLLLFLAWHNMKVLQHGTSPFSPENILAKFQEFMKNLGPLPDLLKKLVSGVGLLIKRMVDGIVGFITHLFPDHFWES